MSHDRRATQHQDQPVTTDPLKLAELEARNGLLQYDIAVQVVIEAIDRRSFRMRPSLLLTLHREALKDISVAAGTWRTGSVSIEKSEHQPVAAHLVAEEIEHLCDYVNDNWDDATALHLAAYVMWRLNWIHPFPDGNGRTSRMISYIILSVKINSVLPGTPQIPDQIASNRPPYFDALEAADRAWAEGRVDVAKMEELLGGMLATQLLAAHRVAKGAGKR